MYLNTEELERISFLIRKNINNDLTDAEESELTLWVFRNPKNTLFYNRCLDKNEQKKSYQYIQNIDTASAWKDIKKELNNSVIDSNKSKIIRRWSYIAAACILIVGSFTLITQWKSNQTTDNLESTQIDYKPASNQAIIKLSNGESFILDSNQNLIEVNSKSIAYSDGKTLASTDDITAAEINTPRGGYYKIILPDGTQAQLNAASSLSYPLAFDGGKREVWISGEVYFDVKKNNKQPFVVHTQRQEIEVLGTSFNVNAYEESNSIKTSLIEGKVKVINKSKKTSSPQILHPNQQSIFNKDKIIVKEIDPMTEIAWLNGKFYFDGKHLKEVMQELSRWYDIDVIIENNVPNIEFFGGTFRNNNLSTILSLLEQNDISYTISKDKKLYIKKKN